MSELQDFTREELVAELIQRGVIRAHKVVAIDKMNVGRRLSELKDNPSIPVGVHFSSVGRFRLFVALPEFNLKSEAGKSVDELVREKVDAKFLNNVRWRTDENDEPTG